MSFLKCDVSPIGVLRSPLGDLLLQRSCLRDLIYVHVTSGHPVLPCDDDCDATKTANVAGREQRQHRFLKFGFLCPVTLAVIGEFLGELKGGWKGVRDRRLNQIAEKYLGPPEQQVISGNAFPLV